MHWVAIAGDYTLKTGRHLEVIPTRLKNSRSHSDADREGLSLELTGGKDNGKNQKAIIELLCAPEKTGWEPEPEPHTRSGIRKRDDSNGNKEDDDKENDDDDDANRAIKFISYKDESTKNENWDVLRLQWLTKYACEDAVSKPSDGSASWGFFTWFIVLLFLGISAYLIFGSWLNYNRYGAKGWDLVPHGDLIRDSPYILKDLVRRVQGTGSRGGYSAV